jgi:uracil-DNA glycosylase family 4
MSDLYNTYVPAVGPRNAKIMIVGEGPGRKEVDARAPFVGPAGKELDKFLASAGLDRSDIYITNVTKFYPKFEKDKNEFFFEQITKDSALPTKAFMDGILELVKEIREVKPNVVVPLGNYALWALTQNTGIFDWRGSILESALVKGLKVIPTIHPAWYIRTFQENKKLLGNWDFLRIAEQSKFPEIRRKKRNFIISPTAEEIDEAIARYTDPSLDHLTADTEWYGPNSLAYIGFADNDTDATCIVPSTMHAFRAYKEILGSPIPKVWQNAMFDAVALYRMGIPVENVAHDTMIAWHNCWGITLEEKSLHIIGSVLTEEPYYKEDVAFVGKGDERGQIYCCTDCVVTDEAHTKMMNDEFPYCGTKRGYEISMSVMNTFIRAAQKGIRADEAKLEELARERITKANNLEDSVSKRLGRTINCRSWPQVQPAVYDDLGIGKRFTERKTDQITLMNIAATLYAENPKSEEVQLLIDIIRVRQNRNEVSRYITPKIIDSDGRTRSFWNLAGTKNGRLSTTIPWWPGVALQTMPEDAREICIADPGCVFVGWDLGQAEARVVAVLAHDYELLDDMARGLDIHVKMAAALPFGLTYEEHQAEIKKYTSRGESKDKYAPRFLAKRTRHASNYIQSAFGLQQQVNKDFLDTTIGVNAAISKQLSEGFLAATPGLEPWWRMVLANVNENGYLVNAFGRRRNWYTRVHFKDHEHKDAVAFYPQSTVADLTTLSIADLDKTDWIFPMLHMHDGGLIQVPEERKDEALEIVRQQTTREIRVEKELLTIPVDLKWGYDWKNLEGI